MTERVQGWAGWARVGVAGLAVMGAAGAGGFLAGQRGAETPQTLLTLATCGLSEAPRPLHLPLGTLIAGGPAVTLGPIHHPGLDGPLSLRFHPLDPGETPRLVLDGDVLEMGLDPDRLPDALHLSCRYGTIARVEYRRGPLRQTLDVAAPADGGTSEAAGGTTPRG